MGIKIFFYFDQRFFLLQKKVPVLHIQLLCDSPILFYFILVKSVSSEWKSKYLILIQIYFVDKQFFKMGMFASTEYVSTIY